MRPIQFTFIVILATAEFSAVAEGIVTSATDAPKGTSSNLLNSEIHERMQAVVNHELPSSINCWGVALWTMGFIDGLRPATKVELLDQLDSSACRKLEPSERVQAGDIGSLYRTKGGIYHSYIVVNDDQIFEKSSPKLEDQPKIFSPYEKFKQKIDLRSGCKIQKDVECGWGIVNYRCDTARIEALKKENFTKLSAERRHVRFLFEALSQAFKRGSPEAASDAFTRYLDYTEELLKPGGDKQTELLASESISGLTLLVVMNLSQFQQLPSVNKNQFTAIDGRFEAMENATPNTYSNFPSGSLPK